MKHATLSSIMSANENVSFDKNPAESDPDATYRRVVFMILLPMEHHSGWDDAFMDVKHKLESIDGFHHLGSVGPAHVTVLYLGDVPKTNMQNIIEAAEGIVEDFEDPIELTADGLGFFDNFKKNGQTPVFVKYLPNKNLKKLQGLLAAALKPWIEVKQHPTYSPHTTLGTLTDRALTADERDWFKNTSKRYFEYTAKYLHLFFENYHKERVFPLPFEEDGPAISGRDLIEASVGWEESDRGFVRARALAIASIKEAQQSVDLETPLEMVTAEKLAFSANFLRIVEMSETDKTPPNLQANNDSAQGVSLLPLKSALLKAAADAATLPGAYTAFVVLLRDGNAGEYRAKAVQKPSDCLVSASDMVVGSIRLDYGYDRGERTAEALESVEYWLKNTDNDTLNRRNQDPDVTLREGFVFAGWDDLPCAQYRVKNNRHGVSLEERSASVHNDF